MKVLHVIPSYLPAVRYGGPVFAVHALARAMIARGHEVTVFTTSVDGPSDLDVPTDRAVDLDQVAVRYFPCPFGRRLYYSPAMGRELRRVVADFDVVHLHSVFLWPTSMAARVAARAGVPYVLSPRGMLVRDLIQRRSRFAKAAWIRLFETGNLERASLVHVTSQLEDQELSRLGFRCPRRVVIPNGVEPGLGSTRDPVGTPMTVVYIGRIHWKKGIDHLVRAMAAVPDATLVIAGNDEDGLQARLERLAHDVGVAWRVRFVGPRYDEERRALLHAADVVAVPSLQENFGNVVVEAMAEGRPVVTTEGVGAAEWVRRLDSGIVVPTGADIGPALARLAADPGGRARMGRAGTVGVRDHLTWAAVACQMERAYADLAPARPTPAAAV